MTKHDNSTKDNEDIARGMCPDEETLGLFVERALESGQMEAVAMHLLDCPRCRESAKEHAEWLAAGRKIDVNDATPAEWQAVRAIYLEVRRKDIQRRWAEIAAAFSPKRDYLAAADGQTADQVQQEIAMRSGFAYFASSVPAGHKDSWHAKWAVPTAVTDNTVLRIQVFDGDGKPVESGTLTFFGVDLGIEEGYAYMPITTFRKNVGVSLIALKRDDGRIIPGEPVSAEGYEPGM